ncbi:hypothetical protein D3C77_304930 [compost metagenome]
MSGAVPFRELFERLNPCHVGTYAQLLAHRVQCRGGRAGKQHELCLGQVIEDVRGDRCQDDRGHLGRLVQVFQQLFRVLWPSAFEQGFRPGTIECLEQGCAQLGLIGEHGQPAVMPRFVQQPRAVRCFAVITGRGTKNQVAGQRPGPLADNQP